MPNPRLILILRKWAKSDLLCPKILYHEKHALKVRNGKKTVRIRLERVVGVAIPHPVGFDFTPAEDRLLA